MNAKVTFDEASFQRDIRSIMAMTGQTLDEQVKEQQRNFLSDALALTPPFGDRPLTESSTTQHKVGIGAVRRDVTKRGFRPLTDLRIYTGNKGKKVEGKRAKRHFSDIGKALRRAVSKKDWHLAEELLRKSKIRTLGVIEEPTQQLRDQIRQKSTGRIERRRSYLTKSSDAKNRKFSKLFEARVGIAKSGWLLAISKLISGISDRNKIFRRMGEWIKAHKGSGVYYEDGIGTDKFSVTVGNAVPYIQRMEPHITERAWNSRMRNIAKQREAIERAIKKKARENAKLRGSVT